MLNEKIQLNSVWEKRYQIARFFIYFLFIIGLFYGLYLILFPSARFSFSFRTPDSSKNTLVEPRNQDNILNKNGKVNKEDKLIFDAQPLGIFSEVEINFTLESQSADLENGSASVRRSFRSFFYPEGNEAEISSDSDLIKFLSDKTSVFLASREKIWPIADAITFESMGFNWNDVMPENSEVIGGYEKQKLFTLKSPHPDGTIFSDKESGRYYLIENKEKKKIENAENLGSFLKTSPIIAEEKGLGIKNGCDIQSSWKFFKKYKCVIPIINLQELSGNDYQFELGLGSNVEIKDISVTFKKTFNLNNLKSSIAILKSRIIANYYGQN